MDIDPSYEQLYLIFYYAIYRQNSSCQTTLNELEYVKCAGRITQAI